MKKNLIYILTVITIVVALNYMHIHSDPYPDYDSMADDTPFFLVNNGTHNELVLTPPPAPKPAECPACQEHS